MPTAYERSLLSANDNDDYLDDEIILEQPDDATIAAREAAGYTLVRLVGGHLAWVRNAARLRAEAEALLKHANELEAWGRSRGDGPPDA
jgi:hypothetical protein